MKPNFQNKSLCRGIHKINKLFKGKIQKIKYKYSGMTHGLYQVWSRRAGAGNNMISLKFMKWRNLIKEPEIY